jgi:hypothetical protein
MLWGRVQFRPLSFCSFFGLEGLGEKNELATHVLLDEPSAWT